MSRLFNPENPVMQFIGKIGYSIFLNALWFICCIPIITAGASTTALFHCSERIVHDQYDNVILEFFHSFRMNFRQATAAWLIVLLGGAILGIDAYVLYHIHGDSIFWTLISAIFIVLMAAFLIILMYLFPLMAHFNNTLFAMFKNSFMIGMRYLVCTAVMAVIYGGMGFLIIFIFTPALFLGMGTCALFCTYLLGNVFKAVEAPEPGKEAA